MAEKSPSRSKQAFAETGKQLDRIIEAYKSHPQTIVWYNDDTVVEYDIVGELGSGSIPNKENAVKVEVGNTVTNIGDYAFRGCSSLTSVTLPDSVTSIGVSAFFGCSGLTSITIPDSVTSIGGRAFSGCSGLTSITIPNSVTSIGDAAFIYCSGLTSITIPDSVSSIGNTAFVGCSKLTEVVFEEKTMAEVQAMTNYSWYIPEGALIVCSDGTIYAPAPGGSGSGSN